MNTNKNRTILTADGFTVSIDHHSRYSYKRPTKARIYVSGEESVDFTEAYAMQRENEAAYSAANPERPFYGKGDFPEEDKLFAKLNRQVVKNQKAVIEEALQTVEGLDFLADNPLTFSKKAGCGCGCSPAFVVKEGIQHDGLWVESIFITLKK